MYKKLHFVFFVAALVACEKEIVPPALSVVEGEEPSEQPVIVSVPEAPVFPVKPDTIFFQGDWEQLETMPVSPGSPAIPTPWSDDANRNFSDYIRNDYKKADGWRWVMGSFSYKVPDAHRFFVLYNAYRGIIRYYFYISTGTQNVSDFQMLVSTLHMGLSNDSPLLNFADQAIVDVDVNSDFVSKAEPWPIEDHTWYAIEHEMAFTPDFSNETSYQSFVWGIQFQKILSLELNGISFATLPVAVKKTGFNFGDLTNTSFTDNAEIILSGNQDFQDASFISSADRQPLDDIMNRYSLDQVLQGIISSGNSRVNWEVAIDLQKKESGVGVAEMSLPIPGHDYSTLPGSPVIYNEVLGVFNLDRRPIVRYLQLPENKYTHQYKLDAKTVRYVFNPAVLKIATIENIQQEVIATETPELFSGNYTRAELHAAPVISSNRALTIQGVRVSFDVRPKIGGPAVKIIKTFKADVAINP